VRVRAGELDLARPVFALRLGQPTCGAWGVTLRRLSICRTAAALWLVS